MVQKTGCAANLHAEGTKKCSQVHVCANCELKLNTLKFSTFYFDMIVSLNGFFC